MARHGNFLLFLYTHISDKKAKHLQRKRKDGENLKELLIDSAEVDVMAGFAIVKDGKITMLDCLTSRGFSVTICSKLQVNGGERPC